MNKGLQCVHLTFAPWPPEENIINRSALSLLAPPAASPAAALPGADAATRAALKLIVSSRQFAKAYRCATLLAYLVEHTLSRGAATPPLEHEIGIAVFGRDPDSYYPGDDPIVRVQAGRLRLRLAAYYADEGAGAAVRISVPLGGYQACIAVAEVQPVGPLPGTAPLLLFRPLVCLSAGEAARCFTSGLNDELEFRLYRDLPAFRLVGPAVPEVAAGRQRAVHELEGTVRQDASRLRVSLHLRHGDARALLWYEQFDSSGDASINAQEAMAQRCVLALQRHLPG